MKPQCLPYFRDAGRLLVPDLGKKSPKNRAACRRRNPYGGAEPPAKWRAVVVAGETPPFPSLEPDRDAAVLASWNRLGVVGRWDVAAIADAIHVFVEVPSVETFACGPVPDGGADPRPFLSDRESVREWLIGKEALWNPAVVRLRADGRITAEAARRLLRRRPRAGYCPDPHALVHFGYIGDLLSLRWDDRTVRTSLPFFRGGCLREVRAAAAAIKSILDGRDAEPALVRRFLVATPFACSAPWLALLHRFADPWRACMVLGSLVRSDARKTAPRGIGTPTLRKMERLAWSFPTEWLFAVVDYGLDPGLLEDGLALSRSFPGLFMMPPPSRRARYRPAIDRILELAGMAHRQMLSEPVGTYFFLALDVCQLWRRAIHSRELTAQIDAAHWRDFPEIHVSNWIGFLVRQELMDRKGKEFRRIVARVHRAIVAEPPARRRIKARVLCDLVPWQDEPVSDAALDDLERIASTLAAGFSSFAPEAIDLLRNLLGAASADQRTALCRLPRSFLKQLQDVARNGQEGKLVAKGAGIWFRELPETDPAWLLRRPGSFLKGLRALGALPEATAIGVCAYLREHPGFGIDPLRIDPIAACLLFDTIRRDDEPDPIPDKFRSAASGKISLSRQAWEHYRGEFASRLAGYQVTLLRARLREEEELLQVPGIDPHTIRFLASLGRTNRRPLRRFLDSVREGRDDYRETHPANLAWIEKHRGLALGEWLSGGAAPWPVELSDYEGAVIGLEHDPQEVLKMGTYAGSCLAAGGCNQYAAVANSLDANKRVAFLRDRNGRPLARQLLAISEEEKLVPFRVYPIVQGIGWKVFDPVFRDFDEDLARRLGLPLWCGTESYEISALVAREWYDDIACLPFRPEIPDQLISSTRGRSRGASGK